ncbi:MAG: hypothetical protein HYS53_01655 [Candidatus Aenigmarchaeota archaeon]|nr:hypothetical protein [Candidatus Aenigmarchaeota archaeon]
MRITICGSISFINEMNTIRSGLEKFGHEILVPESAKLNQTKEFWDGLRTREPEKFASLKRERMKGHFDKVKKSDAILVLNYDKNGKRNYIGPSTFLEMGIAVEFGKKIFVLNGIAPDDPKTEELEAMGVVCLDGKIENIGS